VINVNSGEELYFLFSGRMHSLLFLDVEWSCRSNHVMVRKS